MSRRVGCIKRNITKSNLYKIIFRQRQTVVGVLLYADYKCDESYTPSRISILVGSASNDLRTVAEETINEPRGWIELKLQNELGGPMRTWMIQIVIKQNHQSGRDSHLRQVLVLGPEDKNKVLKQSLEKWTCIR
jgi:anaphase-promoting complex subunit 10